MLYIKSKFSFILLALITFPVASHAQEKFSARVKVGVSADSLIKSEVASNINRELRGLGDVIVTDENPDYIIYIIAIRNQTKRTGDQIGVSFSVVIVRPYSPIYLKWKIEDRLAEDVRDSKTIERDTEMISSLVDGTEGAAYFLHHWLQTGPPEDIQNICRSIVAEFDSETLEDARKRHQKFREYLEREKKKKPNS